MNLPDDYDHQVALLLPLYLRAVRKELQEKARSQRPALKQAWPALRQANWLGEVAARAVTVQEILAHLEEQGKKRWADEKAHPRLHAVIAEKIGEPLRQQVTAAIQNAAKNVAKVQKIAEMPAYMPDRAWVQREQLALARLYIGALVAWRRTDLFQEAEE
jgi:hypothetical protein